jgi:hypothetical protein
MKVNVAALPALFCVFFSPQAFPQIQQALLTVFDSYQSAGTRAQHPIHSNDQASSMCSQYADQPA